MIGEVFGELFDYGFGGGVFLDVEYGEEGVGVVGFVVDFVGGVDCVLFDDEVGEGGEVEEGGVGVEELVEEGFYVVEVDCGVVVEEFEVYVYYVYVLGGRGVNGWGKEEGGMGDKYCLSWSYYCCCCFFWFVWGFCWLW